MIEILILSVLFALVLGYGAGVRMERRRARVTARELLARQKGKP